MKISINSLRWTNSDPAIMENHKKVYEHFGFSVAYTEENIPHWDWINRVLSTNDDVFIFVDCDCVPLNREVIIDAITYCLNGYLVGNAQVTNCIKAKHDLFCAPSFLTISKQFYESIGKPNAKNDDKNDVAQAFTRAAVEHERRIKMYFPTSFQEVPLSGIWRLSSYGYYGVGTIYDNKIYHLYQMRHAKNIDLFVETCEYILSGHINKVNRRYDSRAEWRGRLPIEDEYGD